MHEFILTKIEYNIQFNNQCAQMVTNSSGDLTEFSPRFHRKARKNTMPLVPPPPETRETRGLDAIPGAAPGPLQFLSITQCDYHCLCESPWKEAI